jgi:hypothetical protein
VEVITKKIETNMMMTMTTIIATINEIAVITLEIELFNPVVVPGGQDVGNGPQSEFLSNESSFNFVKIVEFHMNYLSSPISHLDKLSW